MNIYIICPVRLASSEQTFNCEKYVKTLEACGNIVFWPTRDAPQDDETGYNIVMSELSAIKDSDEIHVMWDINSKGSHFDLGMCVALNKKIKIVHLFQPDDNKKSYVKVINLLAQHGLDKALKRLEGESK